jgi:hypothetical protein
MSVAAALPGVGMAANAARLGGKIDPSLVRFSQDSVGSTFRNGNTLNDSIAGLRAGGAEAAANYPPIRVFEHQGALYTLDNRRLVVFSHAGQQVPFRMATEAELAKEFTGKFTTTEAQGWGLFIEVRP